MEGRGNPELLERLQLLRNEPERRGKRFLLEVHVDAEAREPGNRVREVELPLDLQMLLSLAREDAVQELLRVLPAQRFVAVKTLDLAAHPNHGWRLCGHVQVGRVARDHLLEQIVD